MFGREPRLPIGIETTKERKTNTKYVENLKERLKKSYELATNSAKIAQGRQKKHYDNKVRGAILHPGDRVLPNSTIPVFTVRKESGHGRKRTLHRNLLLPIGSVSIDEDQEKEKPRPTPAPRLRPRKNKEIDPQPTPSLHDSTLTSSDEESDDDYLVYVVTEPDVEDLSTPHSTIDELEAQDDDDTVQDEDDDDQEHVAEQQDTGIEGDDLPSEESNTVDPVLEPDEVSETEHQEADISLLDDIEEPGQDDTVDETVDNVTQPDIEAPWIEVQPRRSVRARTSTATTKYKDFVVSKKSQPQPDWKSRADYLKDIASSGTFKGMEDQILASLLKIASEK
ncbi:nucleolin-like [Mytilus trossulus]|uniref:nucleolin-like n=1 Tax=Mytilus trossulus TaxID=6551 RepID=UPI00300432C2